VPAGDNRSAAPQWRHPGRYARLHGGTAAQLAKEDCMRITRIGPISAAKVAFVLYAFGGLIVGCIIAVASLLGATIGAVNGDHSAVFGAIFGVGAVILLPLLYGVLGALVVLVATALYNLIAGLVGGIELTVETAPR
jgi:hypothetical protein